MAPVNLYATMKALPGKEDELAKLLQDLAVNVRNEPGCVRFIVYQLKDNKQSFHVEETYKDEDAFKAHMGTSHGKVFNQTIANMVEGGGSHVVFLDLVA